MRVASPILLRWVLILVAIAISAVFGFTAAPVLAGTFCGAYAAICALNAVVLFRMLRPRLARLASYPRLDTDPSQQRFAQLFPGRSSGPFSIERATT
jgi:hypothetical protein